MADLYGAPSLDAERRRLAGTVELAPAPGPGLLDSIRLGFREARSGPDWGLNQINYEGRVLGPIEEEARKAGFLGAPRARSMEDALGYAQTHGFAEADDARIDELLGWYQEQRKTRPDLLPQYAAIRSREQLRQYVLAQRRTDYAETQRQLQGGSVAAELVGNLGAGLLDPTSYIPIGGTEVKALTFGRQLVSVMLREAAANMAVTAAQEPFVGEDAAALGVPHGAADAALDIGTAGAGGAIIGGTLKTGGHALGLLARRHVPAESMTPTEAQAVNVVERHDEVRASSPFEPNVAGDDQHFRSLDAAIRGRPAPAAGPSSFAAREQVKAMIRGAESSGNDRAVNPNSSASGRYQFTMPTWLSYYRRRYGGGGTPAERQAIWAKRFDTNLQDVLMNDLLADHARALRAAGQTETPGSLYLLHFAGEEGGLHVLGAAPETPVERILSAKAIEKNKFLRGKTAGDLVAWADRKTRSGVETHAHEGGTAPEMADAAEAVPPLPEEAAPAERPTEDVAAIGREDFKAHEEWLDDLDRPTLRADRFATAEEHARAQVALWREQDPAGAAAAATFHEEHSAPAGPAIEVATPPQRKRYGPTDLMQAVADAGGLIDNEGHDLVKGRGIPKFVLGAGAIIRPEGHPRGRSVDAMGEHLWEQGWFGPPSTTERPTEDQVLQLIERAVREKVYRPDDMAAAEEKAARRAAPDAEEVSWELRQSAADAGVHLDPATLDAAMMHRAGGETIEGAVERAVREAAYRDAPASAALERFDDPDGEGAEMQMESLEHDLRMAMEEGDDTPYRIGEGEQTLAEIFDALDREDRAVETLRGCMAPPAQAAE